MHVEYLADHAAVIPTLARWHHEEWSYLNPGRPLEDRISQLQAQTRPKQVPTAFVALSEGTLVGSASLVGHDMDTRMELTPWLASVYVAPEHRRHGYGSALVRRVVEEAETLGIKTLYLFTPDRETFYSRMGWQVLDRTDYRGHSIVIMSIKPSRQSTVASRPSSGPQPTR